MALLVLGFGAGVLVVFLLRTLAQYERASLARMDEAVRALEDHAIDLERRVENLETITVELPVPARDLKRSDLAADTEQTATPKRIRS